MTFSKFTESRGHHHHPVGTLPSPSKEASCLFAIKPRSRPEPQGVTHLLPVNPSFLGISCKWNYTRWSLPYLVIALTSMFMTYRILFADLVTDEHLDFGL